MGQVASLFAIGAPRFQQIIANPASYNGTADALDSEGFNKTFQGVSYVLAKGRDHYTAKLAEQIFAPDEFLGEDFDYSEVDWENDGDQYMMQLEDRIYYHTPAIVKAIADFLSTVTDEEFIKAFDPEEMNREGVYPSGAWNRDNKPNGLYNALDILDKFQLLKSFFIRINTGENYCVCHIG